MKPGPDCPYRDPYRTLTPVGMFCELGASPYGVCEMIGSWGLSAAGYPRASQRWGGGSNTDESSPGGPETLEQGFRCARSD